MIIAKEAWKAGLFRRENWMRNIISGVIVGVVALPLAMAFAIASGVKPEQGLYTAIVAGLAVSLFGGSRLQIAGPTGAFIVILAAITAKYGVDGLQIATLMAGVMLLFFGLARFGSIIKFIPDPVIAGFTAGIGVVIWVGQWPDFFGLHKATGDHFHEKFWHLLQMLPHMQLNTTALALLSITLVIFSPRIPGLKRIPGPLTAMVVATLIQYFFHFEGIATIGSTFGGIPQGLPGFGLPAITVSRLIELIGPAFTIAMLGTIESLLSAVVADGMSGTRHDSNQELIGQGIANILTPFFGGFAATGAIARTATNIRNGGNSPLAGIVHVLTLVLVLLVLSPLAANIPLAALAAILFVVSYNMSEMKHVIHMVKCAPRADVAILLLTFTLTVFADLVVAVNIGVILAMLHFMKRMASSVDMVQLTPEELANELSNEGLETLDKSVMVYAIEGPFFFGAVENFERALEQTHTDPHILLIRMKRVPFVDITGLKSLEEAIEQMKKRGVIIVLSEANETVKAKLAKAGILKLIGERHFHDTFADAINECNAIAIDPSYNLTSIV
jgi:SulP family sulfate permease